MSERLFNPRVPDELEPLLDDRARAVHERWALKNGDLIPEEMDEKSTFVGKERGAVLLRPEEKEDDGTCVVHALPYGQGWKPSMYMRAGIERELVAPKSTMVVLPNNTVRNSYYQLSDNDKARVAAGNMRPFFENAVRILENVGVKGDVHVTGYSMGGVTALGIAGINSDKFRTTLVNADEAPNKTRTPQALQKAFLESGTMPSHLRAIADADMPPLSDVMSPAHLAVDYARFWLASRMANENQALHKGMARADFGKLLLEAFERNEKLVVKLGRICNSELVDVKLLERQTWDVHSQLGRSVKLYHQRYSGEAARGHTTGDNVLAHALMFKDAVRLGTVQ